MENDPNSSRVRVSPVEPFPTLSLKTDFGLPAMDRLAALRGKGPPPLPPLPPQLGAKVAEAEAAGREVYGTDTGEVFVLSFFNNNNNIRGEPLSGLFLKGDQQAKKGTPRFWGSSETDTHAWLFLRVSQVKVQ